MINSKQKKLIKKLLGHRYVKHIATHLEEKNIKNRKDLAFSYSQITNVMNGVPHQVIEEAIFELLAIKNAELEKRQQLLNEVKQITSEKNTDIKKSVAATTDS